MITVWGCKLTAAWKFSLYLASVTGSTEMDGCFSRKVYINIYIRWLRDPLCLYAVYTDINTICVGLHSVNYYVRVLYKKLLLYYFYSLQLSQLPYWAYQHLWIEIKGAMTLSLSMH